MRLATFVSQAPGESAAVLVHVRRKEQFASPLVFGMLALVVAVLRFGPYPL